MKPQFSIHLFFSLLFIPLLAFLGGQCLESDALVGSREPVVKKVQTMDQEKTEINGDNAEINEGIQDLTRDLNNMKKGNEQSKVMIGRGEKKAKDGVGRSSDAAKIKKKVKKNRVHKKIDVKENVNKDETHSKVRKMKVKAKKQPMKTKKRKTIKKKKQIPIDNESQEDRIINDNKRRRVKKKGHDGSKGKDKKPKLEEETDSSEKTSKTITTSKKHPVFTFSNYLLAECSMNYNLIPGVSYFFTTDGGQGSRHCRTSFTSPKGTTIRFSCPVFNLHLKRCKLESLLVEEKKKAKWPFCKFDVVDVETIGNKLQVHHKRKRLPKKKCPGAFLCEITLHPRHGAATMKPHPATMKPHPVTVKPHPATMKPHPVTVKPHPATMKPHPVTVKPHPATMKPHPVTVKPHPTTKKPTVIVPAPVYPPVPGIIPPPAPVQHKPFCPGCSPGDIAVTRIVGGMPAGKDEFIFQARVMAAGYALCSGTLFTIDKVLTAAHCFSRGYKGTKVILGDYYSNLDDDEPYSQVIMASNVIKHKDYDPSNNNNDIAIIELSRPAVISPRVAPACIGTTRDTYRSGVVINGGWGHTEHGGTTSNELRKVALDLITLDECRQMYEYYKYTITDKMICTYTEEKDACQGDSGGPLLRKTSDGKWVVVGIVSFGYKCAYKGAPGVFTNVAVFENWIAENIKTLHC